MQKELIKNIKCNFLKTRQRIDSLTCSLNEYLYKTIGFIGIVMNSVCFGPTLFYFIPSSITFLLFIIVSQTGLELQITPSITYHSLNGKIIIFSKPIKLLLYECIKQLNFINHLKLFRSNCI